MDAIKETRAVQRRRSAGTGAPMGRPRKLTREAVVQAAARIIEGEGDEALTMRSLSAALGVQAATLYTYFDQLDEIREAVLRQALAAIPRIESGAAPLRQQLLDLLCTLRATYVRYPQLATSTVGSVAWEGGLAQMDNVLGQLAATGLELEDALMAYVCLHGVTVNNAASLRDAARQDPAQAQRKLMGALKGQFPQVLQVVELLGHKAQGDDGFRWLIGVLIDRLLPELAAGSGRRAKPRRGRV
jgi:AcrR family transcriptional regulator